MVAHKVNQVTELKELVVQVNTHTQKSNEK